MKNIYKPIVGYEGLYEISTDGVVYSSERISIDSLGRKRTQKRKPIKTTIDARSGYPVVKLTKPNKKYGTQYIHRLVALTYLPNPFNKPCVNHLDSNKLNPKLENLEWVTSKENYRHAFEKNLIKFPHLNYKPLLDRCTGKRYASIKKAANSMSLKYPKLKKMLKGELPNNTCLDFDKKI